MLAAPMLAIIDPAFVPGPMLAMAIAVSAGGTVREWKRRQPAGSGLLPDRAPAGGGAAAFCLQLLSPDAFAAVFGFGVLFAVALSLAG